MNHLLSFVVIAPLLLFWLWMFRDMSLNPDIPDTPASVLAWPPRSKQQWAVMFILLNVVMAGFYFFTLYRERS